MPGPIFKIKKHETSDREWKSKSNIYPYGRDQIDEIVEKSSVEGRWIPQTGDEWDEFEEVFKPLGASMDNYIVETVPNTNGFTPRDYFFGQDGIMNSINEFVHSDASEKDSQYLDNYRDNIYGDIYSFGDEVREGKERAGYLFHTVWLDITEAFRNNLFYSAEFMENNFSTPVKDFSEYMRIYINERHEEEIPDIYSINRIIDFKRTVISLLDDLKKDTPKNKYLRAQKEVYDLHQKCKLIQKRHEDDSAVKEQLEARVKEADAAKAEYLDGVRVSLRNTLAGAMDDVRNGEARRGWGIFKFIRYDNSAEFTNMYNAIDDLRSFVSGPMSSADFSKAEYHEKVKTLKNTILKYIQDKASQSKDPEEIEIFGQWAQNNYLDNPLTKTRIQNFSDRRSSDDGKKRMKMALTLLSKINEEENFGKAIDCMRNHREDIKDIGELAVNKANANEVKKAGEVPEYIELNDKIQEALETTKTKFLEKENGKPHMEKGVLAEYISIRAIQVYYHKNESEVYSKEVTDNMQQMIAKYKNDDVIETILNSSEFEKVTATAFKGEDGTLNINRAEELFKDYMNEINKGNMVKDNKEVEAPVLENKVMNSNSLDMINM